ncbi:MAG: glycosyl transferase [Deltaproteobacteria bacterium]|nr:glycosyl transferase [Deltaproteobacteria bacterium]
MKILFIRRDNIGDLICTTPAIRAVRGAFPRARIHVLVNTYNADALLGNPDVDNVFVYEKGKHAGGRSVVSIWARNASLIGRIRAVRYDWAIGCGSASPRLARYVLMTGAVRKVGFVPGSKKGWFRTYTDSLPEPDGGLHEVERTFRLLAPLGIAGDPPPMRLVPDAACVDAMREALGKAPGHGTGPLVAFHISSRRPENRWPVDRFVALGRVLLAHGARILLLWSPGSEANVFHPGDDGQAEAIRRILGEGVLPFPTVRLRELVAALSEADFVVCGDGGAMHAAAALGKPMVVIWGKTDPARWRPWGTPHVLLRAESRRAADVAPDRAAEAVVRMLEDRSSCRDE